MKGNEAQVMTEKIKLIHLIDEMALIALDANRLDLALTHSSFSKENNERLEFLGNAVLNLCVADLLMEIAPGAEEGDLSIACNHLRTDKVLNIVGREKGLDKLIRVGPSIKGGKPTDSIVAAAYEALIGMLFEGFGYEFAKKFVKGTVLTEANVQMAFRGKDPITRLKEYCDAQHDVQEPKLRKEFLDKRGGNDATHSVTLFFNELTANGVGSTKNEAESRASEEMLRKLGL